MYAASPTSGNTTSRARTCVNGSSGVAAPATSTEMTNVADSQVAHRSWLPTVLFRPRQRTTNRTYSGTTTGIRTIAPSPQTVAAPSETPRAWVPEHDPGEGPRGQDGDGRQENRREVQNAVRCEW